MQAPTSAPPTDPFAAILEDLEQRQAEADSSWERRSLREAQRLYRDLSFGYQRWRDETDGWTVWEESGEDRQIRIQESAATDFAALAGPTRTEIAQAARAKASRVYLGRTRHLEPPVPDHFQVGDHRIVYLHDEAGLAILALLPGRRPEPPSKVEGRLWLIALATVSVLALLILASLL